jgi:hypothetical protein
MSSIRNTQIVSKIIPKKKQNDATCCAHNVFFFTTITFNIKTHKLQPKKKNDSIFQGKKISSKSKKEDDA